MSNPKRFKVLKAGECWWCGRSYLGEDVESEHGVFWRCECGATTLPLLPKSHLTDAAGERIKEGYGY